MEINEQIQQLKEERKHLVHWANTITPLEQKGLRKIIRAKIANINTLISYLRQQQAKQKI